MFATISKNYYCKCLGDYSSPGGPIVAMYLSIYPIAVTVIITVCYMGVWITIQVIIILNAF